MRKSLSQLVTIANEEEARLDASEKAGQRLRAYHGQCSMYYSRFRQYFTWMIAKIPFMQRHDTFELHLNIFGPPLNLHVVVDFLEELTGEKFEALFGCKAGRSQYQYLDDLIVEALQMQGIEDLLGEEAKKAGIDPQNVKRAREWLSEQIETAKWVARHGPIEVNSAEPAKPDNGMAGATLLTTALAADELPKDAGLSLRQVVLWRLYMGLKLVRSMADKVARDAGYHARTSGQQLWDEHKLYAPGPKSRTDVEGRAVINLCNDIEAVIPHLPEDKRQQAEKELKHLKLKK